MMARKVAKRSPDFGQRRFDDFTILTLESYIVQQTDYYPYGLIARKFVRAGEKETKELFQGKTYDELTGWYDFHARQYDAALGRWFGVDPQNQFASPYLAMGNNPVMMVDPDGEIAFLAIAIGAALAGAGYTASVGFSKGGFENWNWGQFGKSLAIGAVSGAATAGIGSAVGGFGGTAGSFGGKVLNEVGRAMLHGQANLMVGTAFGQSPSLSMYAAGAFGSLTGSALHNAGPFGQIGGSALAGGVASKMSGGDFWRGAAVGATVAGLNHAAHAGVEGLKDRALLRRIQKNGWIPIDLSENPYKGVVEGFRVARLYNRGKVPWLNEQFPDGFRIQDLFDYSTITVGKGGWGDLSGEKIGKIYMYSHKDFNIRLDSRSFNIGDVDHRVAHRLTLYDNSKYWAAHQIGWIHYHKHSYEMWLKASSFINR
ncbi:RHS repeat-associated core domain-containing protein [Lunatimonas salinarum]|uniref:RHS repeat-associated core domain-containing protein n=1 Tax=Lunatimonas salinarum TaxID=1774590 RepID=UPI001FD7A9E1|nr:RHS repeat-associated core domain-containing protein [Lunatimonas salinarum]